MTDKLVVDCNTGNASLVPLTAAEEKQAEKDAAAYEKHEQAETDRRAKRDAVLDKLATAAGVSVEELRDALR